MNRDVREAVLETKLADLGRLQQRLSLVDASRQSALARQGSSGALWLEPEHVALDEACERALDELCDWLQR